MSRLHAAAATLLLLAASAGSAVAQSPRPSEPDAAEGDEQPEEGAPTEADEEADGEAPDEGEAAEGEAQPEEEAEGADGEEAEAAEGEAEGAEGEEAEPRGEPYEPQTALRMPRTICHGKRIERIVVRGGRRVSPDDIRATMELRAGVPCTDAEVARDAQALWNLGFFDDIVIEAEQTGEDTVVLYVTVEERPAIGRVVYEGNDEVAKADLDEKVTLREGEILSVTEVKEQLTKIRDLYAEEGFFLARVTYELSEMDDDEVEVQFLIDEGPEVTVRRIRFVGNRSIPGDELRGFMRTSEHGFFSFIASNDTFNREFFEEDIGRLQALYYDRGYLAVSVGTPRIELTPDREHIDLTIPIDEGPRFRIGQLRIAEVNADGEEVEPLGGRRELREMVEANPGDWFSRTTIAQNLLEITRFYRDRGFAKVEVRPQTDLDMEERKVDVVISITRGPPVRIERINVRGNTKTRDLVIRREIRIVEGELYNQSLVEESKAEIQALGYFERVDVSEEEGSAPDRIVINFEVAERPTGTFQVGAGFSSIESFIFTAQVQQQNLFGRGQSLQLQLQLSGIRQLAQLQFVEPYLFGTEWSASANAFKTIRQFSTFNRDSTGGSLSIGHPIFSDDLRVFIRYEAEQIDISSRTGGLFGRTGQGRGFDIFQRIPIRNLFRDGLTSSLQLSLTYDTRDNRLFPTSGVYTSISSEMAESFLGSDNIFVRHRAFARFYYNLFANFVLKLNTEWGLITSREPEGVPIFERFFLGGIFNVRGFGLNQLGPRVGIPRSTDPNAPVRAEGEVIGGNMQFFYNLELEFPILEEIGLKWVFFLDGGNTWNLEQALCEGPDAPLEDDAANPCSVNPLDLRTSWGFGLRWISPLGPLRFEWGLPFDPRSYEEDILFEFTIGNFF